MSDTLTIMAQFFQDTEYTSAKLVSENKEFTQSTISRYKTGSLKMPVSKLKLLLPLLDKNKNSSLVKKIDNIINEENGNQLTIACQYNVLSIPLINLVISGDVNKFEVLSFQDKNRKPLIYNTKDEHTLTGKKKSIAFSDDIKEVQFTDENNHSIIYNQKDLTVLFNSDEYPDIHCLLSDNFGTVVNSTKFLRISHSFEGTCKPIVLLSKEMNQTVLKKYAQRDAYDFSMFKDALTEILEGDEKNITDFKIPVFSSSEAIASKIINHYFDQNRNQKYHEYFEHFSYQENSYEGILHHIYEELKSTKLENFKLEIKNKTLENSNFLAIQKAAITELLDKHHIILIVDIQPKLNWIFQTFGRWNDKGLGIIVEEFSDFFPKVTDPITKMSILINDKFKQTHKKGFQLLKLSLETSIKFLNEKKQELLVSNQENKKIQELQEIAHFLKIQYPTFLRVFKKLDFELLIHPEGIELLSD